VDAALGTKEPYVTEPTTGSALVRYATAAGVATITLDSEHNRNALSVQLMSELLDGLLTAIGDDSVRVIVLSHTGKVFCSGADLKGRQSAGELPVASLPDILVAIRKSPKPVVARVAGPARAGGLGLIGAADLAITTEDATFAFTEVRIGVIPAVISATVLPRLAPRASAELFLTGEVFDGRHAASIGLVTAAVPAAELDDAVERYVSSLVKGAPAALAGTKALLDRSEPEVLRAELNQLASLSAEYFTSAEGQEGIASFREKRNPSWVPSA
jgi:methylglutaconyl-CoA hydratase